MKIECPGMRLTGTGNAREHFRVRAKRVSAEKVELDIWMKKARVEKPDWPCTFTITRIAPGNGLDDDGLAHACKTIRDALADWIGIDDRYRHLVRYAYAQRRGARGEWGVAIESKEGIE